jgi:type IV pilus assembly protein PilW
MKTRSTQTGFTLVELMISMAVSAVLMTGMTAVFIAQVQQQQLHLNRRDVQSNGRQAITFLENTARNAGYGVHPDRAITAYDGFDMTTPATANLQYPDAITFYTRDPLFQRTITAATTSSLTITPALTEQLRPGQVLLIMCTGATKAVYVTVGAVANATATVISLSTAAPTTEYPTTASGARFRQQSFLGDACYDTGSLLKVDRASFYVEAIDDDGLTSTPANPYLMLHRGLDLGTDGITQNDAVPVTAGVEQFQIAYVMNPVTGQVPAILGVASTSIPGWGTAWAGTPSSPTQAPVPAFEDAYNATSRTTSHPANIRQIRISLVARASSTDDRITGDDLFNPSATYNSETLTTSGVVAWRPL